MRTTGADCKGKSAIVRRELVSRSGLKKSEVIQTFEIIQHVKNGGNVSEQMLTELNQKIEKFNIK